MKNKIQNRRKCTMDVLVEEKPLCLSKTEGYKVPEPSLADSKYGNALPAYLQPGLPDFSLYNIPKRGKIYQIAIKYTKRQQNMYTNWP
jgi:hypothetical protein